MGAGEAVIFVGPNECTLTHTYRKTVRHFGRQASVNLEILERFQSKVLRIITDAPGFIPNTVIKHDLQVPMVKQEA